MTFKCTFRFKLVMRICDPDQQRAAWSEVTVLQASNEQCEYILSSQKIYFITFNISIITLQWRNTHTHYKPNKPRFNTALEEKRLTINFWKKNTMYKPQKNVGINYGLLIYSHQTFASKVWLFTVYWKLFWLQDLTQILCIYHLSRFMLIKLSLLFSRQCLQK